MASSLASIPGVKVKLRIKVRVRFRIANELVLHL